MATAPDNNHREILQELLEIDPDLKEHEAVLPQLIEELRTKRPSVTIDPAFVANLRASLLAYKPAPRPVAAAVPSPLLWWAARLAPVGVALALIITLLPHETIAPTVPVLPDAALESEQLDTSADMLQKSAPADTGLFSTESASDDTSSELRMTTAPALVVEPPQAANTVTVTSVSLPEAGWIVVYEDDGGTFGKTLHASYLTAGTYADLVLQLDRSLTYPELITVAVYTGHQPSAFLSTEESLQVDPGTGEPMSVTVPVISELEIEGTY